MRRQRDCVDVDLVDFDDLGLAVNDRALAERLMRMIGVVVELQDQHDFDDRGRCQVCRPARRLPWRRRHGCTVYAAFEEHCVGQRSPEA